jgi:iron complex outermembrane receptor protein
VNRVSTLLSGAAVIAISMGASAFFENVAAESEEPAVWVDDKDPEVITVTGTPSRYGALKSDTPIMETARSVSIETIDQYWDKGALELNDVLGYVSGVSSETYGFSLRGDFAQVRGLSVPEYRDGLQTLFGYYNNTRPHIYLLEQVEVLKGPASVLFGSGSPGGIVNVVSKRPEAEFGGNAFASYGSFDRFEAGADITGSLTDNGKILGRMVAVVRDSGTQIDEINNDTVSVAPSLTFQPSEDTSITLLGEFTDTNSDTAHQFLPIYGTLLPHPSGKTINSYEYMGEPGWNRYDTKSTSISLIGDHRFNDTLSFETTARYRDASSKYNQTWIAFAGNGVPRTDANGNGIRTWYVGNGKSESFAIDSRLRANFTTGALSHEVLAGVHYQDVKYSSENAYIFASGMLNVFDPVYGGTPSQAAFDATAYGSTNKMDMLGFYVSDEITLDNWVLTAGVRFDDVKTNDQKDNAESFSVGLLYKTGMGISPYVSYAESFQPVVGTDAITQAALKPQRGRQYEAGLKMQLDQQLYLTAAYFDIRQSNLSNPNSLVGQAGSQQEGVAKINGFEIEALATLGDFSIEANFSLLDTEDPNGYRLSSVAKTQASSWLSYQPQDGDLAGFRAGTGVRHTGKSESESAAFKAVTPSYTLFDAMIGYTYEDWDFTINVRNIADKDYYTTCLARGDCYPGERRTIVGRVARKF